MTLIAALAFAGCTFETDGFEDMYADETYVYRFSRFEQCAPPALSTCWRVSDDSKQRTLSCGDGSRLVLDKVNRELTLTTLDGCTETIGATVE